MIIRRVLQIILAGFLAFSVAVFADSSIPSDQAVDVQTDSEMTGDVLDTPDDMTGMKETFIQTLNINTANAEEISETLKGIGPVKAAAIVQFRNENGPFKSLEELSQVKGLGAKTIAQNEALISFE
ncbi:MAG: ComEA family DNA-binding protein [Gammaproteobacteria bacterium]